MGVAIGSALAAINYYQNHFAEMFAALNLREGMSIKLDIIPFYQVPLTSSAIPVVLSLLVAAVRGAKNWTSGQ